MGSVKSYKIVHYTRNLNTGSGHTEGKIIDKIQGIFKCLLNSFSPKIQVVAIMKKLDIRSTVEYNIEIMRSEIGMNPWATPHNKLKTGLIK